MCNFTLVPMVPYPAGSCPDMITVGDFNNDNQLDIAAAIACSSSVGILLGYGNGTFAAKITSSASNLSSSYAIAAGDFNKDHLLDIVFSDRSSNKFGIIFGNGDRTFQAQMTYATGPSPYSVAVGNFNNDNRLRILLLFKCLIGMYKNYQ